MKPSKFYNDTIGKNIDIDGFYGAQCWDLFAYYCREEQIPIFNCTITGYVIDIWTSRGTNDLLLYFDEISLSNIEEGDWVIWGESSDTPNTHIAMFLSDNGNGSGVFLGQNQNGQSQTSECSIKYNGIATILRRKYTYDKWKFSLNVPVTIRYGEIGIEGEETGYFYIDGDIVNFDRQYTKDNYHWISYLSYSGKRCSVAIGKENEELWGNYI